MTIMNLEEISIFSNENTYATVFLDETDTLRYISRLIDFSDMFFQIAFVPTLKYHSINSLPTHHIFLCSLSKHQTIEQGFQMVNEYTMNKILLLRVLTHKSITIYQLTLAQAHLTHIIAQIYELNMCTLYYFIFDKYDQV